MFIIVGKILDRNLTIIQIFVFIINHFEQLSFRVYLFATYIFCFNFGCSSLIFTVWVDEGEIASWSLFFGDLVALISGWLIVSIWKNVPIIMYLSDLHILAKHYSECWLFLLLVWIVFECENYLLFVRMWFKFIIIYPHRPLSKWLQGFSCLVNFVSNLDIIIVFLTSIFDGCPCIKTLAFWKSLIGILFCDHTQHLFGG